MSEDTVAAAPPPAPSARPWLIPAVIAANVSAILTACILALSGVLTEVGFWRVMSFSLIVSLVIALRLAHELTVDIGRWEAIATGALGFISTIKALPSVRCADCHVTAHVSDGPIAMTDKAEIRLPHGWEIRNERPYCPSCLA